MAKICFVSYEIHPTVMGGCGVLLYNAARLLLSQNHEVIFLLDLTDEIFNCFNEIDRLNLPNPGNCRAYQVQALTKDQKYSPGDFKSEFEYRAYRFHFAASEISRMEQPDVIEFFEYCGVAYYALCAKVAGLAYHHTHLTVRLHNSMELIDRQQRGNIHSFDRYLMYNLEHHALKLAEFVLYPSGTYLEKAYRPHYEAWFGRSFLSEPPLVGKPDFHRVSEVPDIILYYSRLVGFKGVDRFVDAAVLYLNEPSNPRRRFFLIGYDSYLPPNSKGSYQTYLQHKIPPQFQDYFHFTGQLSWQELGKLLPEVLFAVIPSYYESFCYAAHELYEAGIPIIVSDIPAFQDYFQHEVNALVFDGTVSHLAQQITRLSTDDELRRQITFPHPVFKNPLGDFYATTEHSSWISKQDNLGSLSLLVCILCDQPEYLNTTFQALKPILSEQTKVVLFRPVQEDGHIATWFLGKLYSCEDELGHPLDPTQILTADTLLVLKSGDIPESSYFLTCLSTLQRQPEISFVGSWKKVMRGHRTKLETLPLDASLELLPFLCSSPFSRFIYRTISGKLLIDLFDPRAGRLGEIAYLWKLDVDPHCGIIIPEPLLTQLDEDEQILKNNAIDYLIIQDDHIWRQKRLARFLLSLPDRSIALQKISSSHEPRLDQVIVIRVKQGIYWLGSTRFNRWMDRLPWLKNAIRKVAETMRLLEPKKS